MSESTRTPGPWETAVVPFEGTVYIAVIQTESKTEDGCKAVAFTGKAGASDEIESILNADLIAAAPDLLEKLENALPILDDAHQDAVQRGHSDPHWQQVAESLRLQCEAAREAIAKAKGEA